MKFFKKTILYLFLFFISNISAQLSFGKPRTKLDIDVYDSYDMLKSYQTKGKFKIYTRTVVSNKNISNTFFTYWYLKMENTSCFDVNYNFRIDYKFNQFTTESKRYKGVLKAGEIKNQYFRKLGDYRSATIQVFTSLYGGAIKTLGTLEGKHKNWQKNPETIKCLGFKSIDDFNQKIQNKKDKREEDRKKKEKEKNLIKKQTNIINNKKWIQKWQNKPNELYQFYLKNKTKQGVFVNKRIDSLTLFSKITNKPILMFGVGSIGQLKNTLKKASQNKEIQNQKYITTIQYNNSQFWNWAKNNLVNFTGLPAIILIKKDGSASFFKFNISTQNFHDAMNSVNAALIKPQINKSNTVKKKRINTTAKDTITTKWKNGNIKAVFEQQNGKKAGSYTRYFEYHKGVIAEKGMYSKGKPVGKWEAYYTNGNVKKITKFAYKNNDKIVNLKSYYFSGKLKAKYQTVNGNFDGTQTNYDENGKITRIQVFKNGKKIKDIKKQS